jgi:hypothetical protein
MMAVATPVVNQAFMLVEIAGDELFFQTVSRTGATVDSGVLETQTNVNSSTSAGRLNRSPGNSL